MESKQLVLVFDAVYRSPPRFARRAAIHRSHTRTLAWFHSSCHCFARWDLMREKIDRDVRCMQRSTVHVRLHVEDPHAHVEWLSMTLPLPIFSIKPAAPLYLCTWQVKCRSSLVRQLGHRCDVPQGTLPSRAFSPAHFSVSVLGDSLFFAMAPFVLSAWFRWRRWETRSVSARSSSSKGGSYLFVTAGRHRCGYALLFWTCRSVVRALPESCRSCFLLPTIESFLVIASEISCFWSCGFFFIVFVSCLWPSTVGALLFSLSELFACRLTRWLYLSFADQELVVVDRNYLSTVMVLHRTGSSSSSAMDEFVSPN